MQAQPSSGVVYKPSRYVSLAHDEDGSMIVHCSLTGAIGVVPPDQVELARNALRPGALTDSPVAGVLADLAEGGFLVADGTDEPMLAHTNYIQRYTDPRLHLILMPTEQCNFRCTYCYESFARGEMSAEIQAGVVRFVQSQPELERLVVSWFGGEPFLAPEVVKQMTAQLNEVAAGFGAEFFCGATTNGSLMVPSLVESVIPLGLRFFQVSLDGMAEDHNQRRVGRDGESTFDSIIQNLLYLHNSRLDFEVAIRYNIDPTNAKKAEQFYEFLQTQFQNDSRFVTELQPIGKWGGPNDETLEVCEGATTYRTLTSVKRRALEAGFLEARTRDVLKPNGAVCYAADPRSFVIGSDGSRLQVHS